VYDLSRSIGAFFRNNGAKRVSIGRDARESSPRFRDILIRGLNEAGCDLIDVGMVPTPLLYFSLFKLSVDAGVMITGSHNPADSNGFKICLGKSTVFGDQINEIKKIAFTRAFLTGGSGGIEERDVIEPYLEYVRSNIDLGPRRLKILVDGGNGMG